jgi:hypothetical protein
MLTITPSQLQVLDQYQDQQFRQRLCTHIQETYPDYADMSPVSLHRILDFALARAKSYGLIWQSSLGQFVYLMAAIAPNFDMHPAIHAILTNQALAPEDRISSLTQRLPAGVWQEAITNTSTIGWFLAKDGFGYERADRFRLALTNALPKSTTEQTDHLDVIIKQALQSAEKWGFVTEDQQFVFTAASLYYGENLSTQMPWSRDTFTAAYTPDMQCALLRVRLAIDVGIWI